VYRLKKFDVWASEIAGYLNKELVGEDFIVKHPRCIKTETFIGHSVVGEQSGEGDKIFLITTRPISEMKCSGYIVSDQPDLDLAYILREFFATGSANQIHPSAVVSEEARIGRNVMIGAHSIIGPDVEIADNSKILSNVAVNGQVSIGKFCVIKDGAIIGSEGWAFVNDEDGIPFHAPQLGRILIGDRVWIGSNTTIERGMIEDTTISKDVKIDDLVHIGAGSHIGEKCEITAGVVVASHVLVGKNVRIAPNAVIREGLRIGDGVTIGLGAVVVKDVPLGSIYVGNPARLLRKKTAVGR
jgi:UDP-3-O-[3-hydroxymyristoyl] glucosamine N-acyltransferase